MTITADPQEVPEAHEPEQAEEVEAAAGAEGEAGDAEYQEEDEPVDDDVVERPDDVEYQILTHELAKAKRELYELDLVGLYDDTKVDETGKTIGEHLYGPHTPRRQVLFGVKRERARSAAKARAQLLTDRLEDWDAREKAHRAATADGDDSDVKSDTA